MLWISRSSSAGIWKRLAAEATAMCSNVKVSWVLLRVAIYFFFFSVFLLDFQVWEEGVGGWLWKLGSHPLANLSMCLTSVQHWGWGLRKPVWDMMWGVKENCAPLPNLTYLKQSTVASPAPGLLLCILLGYIGGVVIPVLRVGKFCARYYIFFFWYCALAVVPKFLIFQGLKNCHI